MEVVGYTAVTCFFFIEILIVGVFFFPNFPDIKQYINWLLSRAFDLADLWRVKTCNDSNHLQPKQDPPEILMTALSSLSLSFFDGVSLTAKRNKAFSHDTLFPARAMEEKIILETQA